jgi:hypothetical protein
MTCTSVARSLRRIAGLIRFRQNAHQAIQLTRNRINHPDTTNLFARLSNAIDAANVGFEHIRHQLQDDPDHPLSAHTEGSIRRLVDEYKVVLRAIRDAFNPARRALTRGRTADIHNWRARLIRIFSDASAIASDLYDQRD